MARIEFTGLTKRYGDVTAVDDLTFTLAPGWVTGFVGANGAGKSTSMRTLLGLTRPSAGSATIDGHAYADLADPIRSVGAMVDPDVFHPRRSARNALRVIARAVDLPSGRVDDVIARVGLAGAARRRVGGFSMGMRHVAIIAHGRLVAHQPMVELLGQAEGSSLEEVYLSLTAAGAAGPSTQKELS